MGILDDPRLKLSMYRVSHANKEYKLCETYPRFLVVPDHVDD